MQPIVTAPKDGERVLLRFEGLPDGFTHKEPFWIEGWWFENSKPEAEGWETPLGFIGEPTHWDWIPSIDISDSPDEEILSPEELLKRTTGISEIIRGQ